MSIFKNKIVMFLLALFCIIPFSFALVGCGEPAGMNAEQARTAANTQIKEAVKNSTMVIDASYGYAGTTEASRIKVEFDNGNVHSQEFNEKGELDSETWGINGYEYSRIKRSHYINGNKIANDEILGAKNGGVDLSKFIELAKSSNDDIFADYIAIASKFSNSPVKAEVVNGVTTLTIGADVSSAVNKLLANFTKNYNQPLAVFINQIIDDVLGQAPLAEGEEPAENRVTISSILKNFTNNLTAETTIADVVEYVENEIGTKRISQTLEIVSDMPGMFDWKTISQMPVLGTLEAAMSAGELDLPFADSIKDEQGHITGESLYNGINEFLASEESSIDSLVTMIVTSIKNAFSSNDDDDDSDSSTTSYIEQYIPMLSAVDVTKAEFTIKVIFDANNKLTGMSASVSGVVAMGEESTMGADATINIAFSNVGTTKVAAPTEDVSDLDIDLTVNLEQALNAEQNAYVIALPTLAFVESFSNVDDEDETLVLAAYNKETNQLTINKAWADKLIEEQDYIEIYKWDPATNVCFSVKILPQEPEQAVVQA